MDNFSKAYSDLYNALFKPLGFERCKSNCYRVVGDVFQTFEVAKYPSGGGCHIHFGAIPLCSDMVYIQRTHTPDMYDLRHFSKIFQHFHYENNENGIRTFMENLSKDFIAHMIPFFEKAIDCIRACDAITKLETQLDNKLVGCDELKSKAFVFLKAGEYDGALGIFKQIRDGELQCIQGNFSWQESEKDLHDWKDHFQEKSEWWDQRIALIETRDKAKILPWLLENEQKNLMELGLEKEK